MLQVITNWPAILATLGNIALTIVTLCTLLSGLFAALAVAANLALPKTAAVVGAKLAWVSALFGHLGASSHDFFVHVKILPDPGAPGGGAKPPAPLVAVAAIATVFCAIAIFIAGCLSQKEAKVISDIGADVECIFAHDDGTMTPIQIGVACGGIEEKTVIDILSEKHKAEAVAVHRAMATPSASASTGGK